MEQPWSHLEVCFLLHTPRKKAWFFPARFMQSSQRQWELVKPPGQSSSRVIKMPPIIVLKSPPKKKKILDSVLSSREQKKKCRDRWRRTRIGGEGKKQKEAQTGKECKIEVKGAIVRNRGRYRKKIATAELTTQCAVGKGSIDLLCPVWAAFSKKRCCIHLTQKNLLSNFVWDEVTENCKFSHAVENHPA